MSSVWTDAEVIFEPANSYHARKVQTSASQTKDFIKSPRLYFRKNFLGLSEPASASMEFGSAVHEEMLLEAVERSYLVIPKEALSSNGAKKGKAWESYRDENVGRLLLKESEVTSMELMLDAVRKHPLAKAILEEEFAYKEITLTANTEVYDSSGDEMKAEKWPLRGRLDYISRVRIKDIKTTGDLSPQSMRYKPYDLGWDVQGAYYRRLWHALTGVWLGVDFIVVETKEPYRVEVWGPSEETLAKADEAIDVAHQEMFSRWKEFSFLPDENIWQRKGFDTITLF